MKQDIESPVRWRSALRPAFAVVAILGLVETLLHIPAVRRGLPMPDPFYAPGVEARVRCLERFIASYGQPDVVFLGSSVVGSAIIPAQFDTHVREAGGAPLTSFNLWMSGLNSDPVRLYWERFWSRRCQPRYVVQGVRLTELCAGPAENYDRFASGRIERYWIRPGHSARIAAWMHEHTRLLYYGGFLPAYLRDMPWPPTAPRGTPIDSRGRPISMRGSGDGAVERRLPTPCYDMPQESARLSVGLRALSAVAAWCREQGVGYVVVNIPEHRGRFEDSPQGVSLYAFYLETVRRWADSEGVIFLDVTGGQTSAYGEGDFAYDRFHMEDAAAERFTSELADLWWKSLEGRLRSPAASPVAKPLRAGSVALPSDS